MKKGWFEVGMAVLLLASVFYLSKEVAQVVGQGSGDLIMIDIGHGGSDPGMIGVDNVKEKDINLKIALCLRDKLKATGYQVIMTREKDEGLYDEETVNKKVQDLQRRCDLIEKYKPLLTLSIHQNSYADSSVRGPQVFYYEHSAQGEKLANSIQEALNTYLEVERPRLAKGNTNYYLLKKSEGVLNIVECGFLTNPDEAALLQEEEYQDKVAQAICLGMQAYLRKVKG